MGKKKHPKRGDKLKFYERILCCCKCRAESKTRATQFAIYFFIPSLVLSLAAACICLGIIFRTDCTYNKLVPYWVISSAVTPLLLFLFIKAIKEDHTGVTFWRTVSLVGYGIFLGWLIIGCIWVYDTWIYVTYTCKSCCDSVLINFAFALTFVHWVFAIVAAIPNVYIITKMLCCHANNTVKPLKG